MNEKKLISIVTPCFNEELNIEECWSTVKSVFQEQLPGYDYEHIFCDNASTDRTLEVLRRIATEDARVKIIVNSRNFGGLASMFNGLLATTGEAVVPFVPADLQDPPEIIPFFVKEWENGYSVVYGVRAEREEGFLLHTVRKLYYRAVSRFASINIPLNVGEFTLIDKKIVDVLRSYDDYHPYLRGMIANCGFKTTSVSYTWKARKRGYSKAGIWNLFDVGLNGIISFTNIPMRVSMGMGLAISIFSILYAVVTTVITLVEHNQFVPPGIPTLIAAVFFFSGINLFFLGLLGEYVSAIHFQVRKRPLVIEAERVNFDLRTDQIYQENHEKIENYLALSDIPHTKCHERVLNLPPKAPIFGDKK